MADLPAGRRGRDGAAPGDAGLGDAGLGDAGLGDATPGDAGLGDAGLGDAGLGDATLGDATLGDAGLGDAGLGDAIRACRHCAPRFAATATAHAPRPVFRGAATARILVAGQAPGARVHASGLPFDDASGERLRGWMGIDRATFYDAARVAVLPMAFCFPGYDAGGADLPPPPDCARLWRARALGLFPAVGLTLAVGLHAQRWHLGPARGPSLTATVRDWRRHLPATVPLPHPSWRNTGWLARNPWFGEEVLPWLQDRVAALL